MLANIGSGLLWGVWGGFTTYSVIRCTPLKHIASERALYPKETASGIVACAAFAGRLGGGGHHAISYSGITVLAIGIFNISHMLAEQNKEIQQLKKNQQLWQTGINYEKN